MKLMAYPLLGAGMLAAFTACDDGGGSNDTSDTSDTNAAISIDFNWDNDGYAMSVTNMVGSGYDLGLAETGAPSGEEWFGEDCFNGTAGYNICHGFNGASASLNALGNGAAPGDPDDVVAGSTTLLNKDLAYNGDGTDRVTYMITFDDQSCIAWGQDPSHYSSFSCTVY